MVTQEDINAYINKIPPVSETLQTTIKLLMEGELVEAANVAKEDLALSAYLKHLVNTPSYGFKNEVSEVSQIFGILGVSGSQQSVYNYMINLLSPDEWELFELNASAFANLQADLSGNWKKILNHLKVKDNAIESSIALLPASIIVSEAIFCEKKDDVILLRSVKAIDFNTILKRLAGKDLFDVSEQIAQRWNMSEEISQIIQAASGIKPCPNEQRNTLGKWMHLLLFFTLSKTLYIESGLNDFIEFQIEYVEEIYEDFATLMEIS